MATLKSGTPTLKELESQIAALQARAEEVRRTEIADVIDRIREAIDYYGLTASDLGLGAAGRKTGAKAQVAARKAGAKKAPKKASGVPKYTDGAGKTWTGRGKRPAWFLAGLAAGKAPQDMLIKGN